MKLLKHVVAAVAALSILTSCSVMQGLVANAGSAGNSTGNAIATIYNIFKSTGGIDLSNITTLINLGKILTGANALAGKADSYVEEFANGLYNGSADLVNEKNIGSVINALQKLANVDSSAITNAVSSYTGGAAPAINKQNAQSTVSALTNLLNIL
ncbi:MAG: hypothetical protein IJ156_01735 [Bacteroidales bacterium]|nr:hypothetical protein [Bacteroidales bacterium]